MFNYDSKATIDDASCYPIISGCTDVSSHNYVLPVNDVMIDVNTDDGSCYPVIIGCMDSTADNFISLVDSFHVDINTPDNSLCIFYGCINEFSFNYDSLATDNDNSCYPVIVGCTDTLADNFNDYDGDGSRNDLTGNVNTDINTSVSASCIYLGCTDSIAFNYHPIANTDDGSCVDVIAGCMYEEYIEFNVLANTDGGGCITLKVFGCMNEIAFNYDPLANINDESCYDKIYGCLDLLSDNYNDYDNDTIPNILTGNNLIDINTNDSTLCLYYGCTDHWASNYDSIANLNDGSCFLHGCMEEWADNYNSFATFENDTCSREGCTSDWASNFDSLATQNTIEAD
jgi:hypothetical protein